MVFAGTDLLAAAQQRVGWITSNCASLEHAIAYLEWQLMSFALAADNPGLDCNDLQKLIREKRGDLDKYSPLEQRLRSAGKAFEAAAIVARLEALGKLKEVRRKWNDFRERAVRLSLARNATAHSFLSVSAGKVYREVGRPWNERQEVNADDDMALIRELGQLETELGVFATELGFILPFADTDQIITITNNP